MASASCFFAINSTFAQLVEVDPAGELSVYTGQVSAPPPPQIQGAPMEGDATYFYDSLKPHGDWMQVSPFGPVWRPHVTVKDSTWRPYYHGGKWVWQKNAWYWNSEYEWGWAPFHYGRWIFSNGLGWVWIPGRQWSAAWVDWRKSSTQYGWAPMPPDKSLYVGIGGTSHSGLSWGFQFSLTDDHYSYMPCNNFVETVYVYDSGHGYNYGYNRYYDHTYWPHNYRSRDYDNDRRPKYDHHDNRPVYDKPNKPEPVRTSEPSRRTTIMQQVVARTAPATPAASRPIQQVVSQPRSTTPVSSRPAQQVVSQPRTASINVSKGNSPSAGRSTRMAEIISRTQRK